MKRTLIVTTAVLILTGAVIAQPRMGLGMRGNTGIYDQRMGRGYQVMNLTEEQQNQVDALCTAHIKEMKPFYDQVAEKTVKLRTLNTSEKIDSKAIDKMIVEIGAANTEIARKQAAHRQNLSQLLTEEQRVIFNNRPLGRGMSMYGKGMRGGMGSYGGRGMRSGMGSYGGRGMRGGMGSYGGRGMRGGMGNYGGRGMYR